MGPPDENVAPNAVEPPVASATPRKPLHVAESSTTDVITPDALGAPDSPITETRARAAARDPPTEPVPVPLLLASPAAPPPPPLLPSHLFDVRVLLIATTASSPSRWYNVRLVCRLRPTLSWRVTRRFSDFDALLQRLRADAPPTLCHGLPSLPPKLPHLLLTPALQQRRVLGLQKLCQELLASPAMCADARVGDFFDLSFGLWHVQDAAPPPPLLDPAQYSAAALVQAHVRRMCVLHRVKTASEAVAHCCEQSGREDPRPGEREAKGEDDDPSSLRLLVDHLTHRPDLAPRVREWLTA